MCFVRGEAAVDLQSRQVVKITKGVANSEQFLASCGDGGIFVSKRGENKVTVWERNGHRLRGLSGRLESGGRVTFGAISQNGRAIVTGWADRAVQVWSVESMGRMGEAVEGHSDKVTCVALLEDGRLVVRGSLDMSLHVGDT